MLKKIIIILSVLIISLVFMIPSGANPSDVVIDQQVELMIPGQFAVVDNNKDHQMELLNFTIGVNAYQQGEFIVTGNLEGMKDGQWVNLGTTVIPFSWTPEHKTITLGFHPGQIYKSKLSGPYRVSMSLKKESWELPSQIVGFSPKYKWDIFNGDVKTEGDIATSALAKETAESWAEYNNIRLGNLVGIGYNYDHWQVDYQERLSKKILRFLVSPWGKVKMLTIRPKLVNND